VLFRWRQRVQGQQGNPTTSFRKKMGYPANRSDVAPDRADSKGTDECNVHGGIMIAGKICCKRKRPGTKITGSQNTFNFLAISEQRPYLMRMEYAHKEFIMQRTAFDASAPKKSTNLSINSDLLQQAKELRINLSQTLELRLAEILRDEKRRNWQEENREAIEEYNRRVEACGVFNDGQRQF